MSVMATDSGTRVLDPMGRILRGFALGMIGGALGSPLGTTVMELTYVRGRSLGLTALGFLLAGSLAGGLVVTSITAIAIWRWDRPAKAGVVASGAGWALVALPAWFLWDVLLFGGARGWLVAG